MAGPILQYTGNPFTTTTAGSGNVTATFQFAGPLTNGSTLTLADVVSFSISAAGRTTTSADTYSFVDIAFVIGPSLLPVSWHFEFERNIEGGASPEQWTSRNSFPGRSTLDAFSVDDLSPNNFLVNGTTFSAIFDSPGSWSAVPEPSAAALSLSGILVLTFLSLRRGRRN